MHAVLEESAQSTALADRQLRANAGFQPQRGRLSSRQKLRWQPTRRTFRRRSRRLSDFRHEKRENTQITLKDLPTPYATASAGNGPQVVRA